MAECVKSKEAKPATTKKVAVKTVSKKAAPKKAVKTVVKKVAKTAVKKAVKKAITSLRKTAIPMNFVKNNNGEWDHSKWEEFITSLKEKGYVINSQEDLNAIGLLLEDKKEAFFASK